jgi:hypothetical protein
METMFRQNGKYLSALNRFRTNEQTLKVHLVELLAECCSQNSYIFTLWALETRDQGPYLAGGPE